jgi:lysophospholipase
LLSSQPASIALINESSTPSSQTPLHLAVLTAQLHNVVLLLANGASVHSRDILSHTALFYAARLGGPGLDIVTALRGAGAHLGETEIERGDVGLEILRAEMSNEASSWMEAAGEDVERAKLSARNIVRP